MIMTRDELFIVAYAQTNRAADLCNALAGTANPTTAETKEWVRLLTEALCAARELDNRVAGNPPPKIG
jgi:hypothetical protein